MLEIVEIESPLFIYIRTLKNVSKTGTTGIENCLLNKIKLILLIKFNTF